MDEQNSEADARAAAELELASIQALQDAACRELDEVWSAGGSRQAALRRHETLVTAIERRGVRERELQRFLRNLTSSGGQ